MSIQWPLVVFSLVAGCAAGMLVFMGVAALLGVGKKTRELASLVVMAFLALGGGASVLHLAQPAHVMAAITNIGSLSGISVELILLSATFVCALVYFALSKRDASDSGLKVVAVLGGVFGLVMAFSLGNSYIMEARDSWNTVLLPLAYLGSNLAIGGFAFAALGTAAKEGLDKRVAYAVISAALVEAVFFVAYPLSVGAAQTADPLLLWLGVMACGAVLPVVMAVLLLRGAGRADGSEATLSVVGCVGAVVGGISLRCLMWLIGTTVASFLTMGYFVL